MSVSRFEHAELPLTYDLDIMKTFLLPTVLGGVILFFWQFLSFAAINLHGEAQEYTPLDRDIWPIWPNSIGGRDVRTGEPLLRSVQIPKAWGPNTWPAWKVNLTPC